MKFAVVLGSSRSDGNTSQLSQYIAERLDAKLIDLNKFSISAFDYENRNIHDDFASLIESLIHYSHIIFATPVYWYSMSSQMKVFFDRFTDLLTVHKDLGRSLRGIKCSVVSTGTDATLPECFLEQFKLTFDYLGMEFVDCHYSPCPEPFSLHSNKEQIEGYIHNVA
jgi:multimeric flavodoxin WrbA